MKPSSPVPHSGAPLLLFCGKRFLHHNDWPVYNSTIHFNMRFINYVLPLLLISAFILESDAWWRSRRRRRSSVSTGCSTAPRALARTSRDGCTSPYTNLETCTYRCLFGYIKVSGSTIRTCYNGRWTGTNLVCGTRSQITCPHAPTGNANVRDSGVSQCAPPYTQGEICDYTCITGYNRVTGTRAIAVVMEHGLGVVWSVLERGQLAAGGHRQPCGTPSEAGVPPRTDKRRAVTTGAFLGGLEYPEVPTDVAVLVTG
ncbi:uncharacterized protein [Branchiostoma lanceolatum]|uniref:uncharacterized protein n=1 Tax=Branchiostoma lanceolatum TaxID=7740 RepID=UPI0034511B7F